MRLRIRRTPAPARGNPPAICARHYAGILLIACATLLLELALARVLSVALWYHYSFLVISTAMLGFGTSGVLLAVWPWLRERANLDRSLALLAAGFSLATLASFALLPQIPFDPFAQKGSLRHNAIMLPLYYLTLALPFFWAGLAIALLLTRGLRQANRLYAADLLGAGAGCALVVVVLPLAGGSGAVCVAAALGFAAAGVFASAKQRAVAGTAGLLLVASLTMAPFADEWLPIRVAASKQHTLQPEPPRPPPLYTGWNAMSRVDVHALPAAPAEGWPGPGISFVIDGGSAATGIGDLRAGLDHWLARDDYRPPGLAYVGKQSPEVLVIGAGGGREVMEALYFGAASVTAVEMNPIITRLVTQELSEFVGGLFQRPEVRLVTAEGRSFVHRSRERYDAIVSVQSNSNAALASGALGLAEGYMFTREAIAEYLDHLAPDGVLLITRLPVQVGRLVATIREVFEARGLGSVGPHLLVAETANLPWGPRRMLTVLLLKKSPWTETEVGLIRDRLAAERAGPAVRQGAPARLRYSPFDQGRGGLYEDIVTAPDLDALYAAQPFDISPVSDDRPFFNQQLRWSELSLRTLNNMGTRAGTEAVVVLLLIQTSVIAALCILLPLARLARTGLRVAGRAGFLAYFAGLGLGFIMLEIALLQRFTLFLGEPLYAFAVVVGSLLVFTGLGAFAGQRLAGWPCHGLRRVLPGLLAVLALTVALMPAVFDAALGFAVPWRVLIAVALVAPLGLLAGIPFPAGLRRVGAVAPGFVPWAWGVNGFFTVIGSVLAMLLGMIYGFSTVLAVAAGCYLLSWFVSWTWAR